MKFLGHVSFAAFLLSSVACGGGAASGSGPANQATTTQASASAGDSTLPKPADHPESDKVSWKADGKSCHPNTKAVDLVAGVTAIANGCVDTKAMHQVGQPTTGQGAASTATMVQTIPLKGQANHCYRVFGLADPTVTDFDIAIMDSAGKSIGEDLTDSNDAIVLENGSFCFKQDDTANVNTAVAAGTGKWAVEIWSN
ncbi:MAG TPA: hypothetical protein VGI39_20915 [Polyangiaceae bacterium]|jgi:hypothetical protein